MSRILILMYHIIDRARAKQEAKFCLSPDRFEAQMRFLHESGKNLLSLDQIATAIEGKSAWPTTGVAVTFDDGFRDTFHHALPVLTRYNIPATMFMLADRIGANNNWMTPRGFPERELMTQSEMLEMQAAGVCIGSHTCSHPNLPQLDAENTMAEIRMSREKLQTLTGSDVNHFAYPFGLYDDKTLMAVAAAGYRTACSTRSGFNGEGIDPYLLRRIEIYGNDTLWQFKQKLKFGSNDMSYTFPLRYYTGRVLSRFGRK
ncbi:polysaccharide deacetylase [Sulfuricella sp. T08]|uniref:polysaccharide deacetylase family protein n=1 Tax=Sulfuricella sp. T08 TaxID=1632857 RepID=UPI0006179C43|nr:polysaccharide deacetylase family protein [Sulfuricella sp. T08]GAO34876.1 polysaccharide deacetylase [Sulfuricella sp. T08]